jgi:hypothetical protein
MGKRGELDKRVLKVARLAAKRVGKSRKEPIWGSFALFVFVVYRGVIS